MQEHRQGPPSPQAGQNRLAISTEGEVFPGWSAQGFAWCFCTTGCFKIRCWVGSPGGHITPTLVSGLWAVVPAIKVPAGMHSASCFPRLVHVYFKYFHAQSQTVSFPLVGGLGPRKAEIGSLPKIWVLIQLNSFLSISGSPAVLFALSGFLPDIPKGCPFWQEGHILDMAPNSPQHPGRGFQRGRYHALELGHKGQAHLH